jgi:hypothetical protein
VNVRSGTRILARCALLALLLASCTITSRVPTDVAAALARDDMRVLRSQNVDLYYPAQLKHEAEQLSERIEGCVQRLRAAAVGKGGLWRDRLEVLFPDMPYNNAFVHFPLNGDFFSVIPSYWTLDVRTEFGLPPGPGYVACHELTHYIHGQQTLRSLGGLNKVLGYVISPQVGLDAWFAEGLATYYEQALQPGTGRPAWPAWEGLFHAAVAGKHLRGGDLSAFKRQIHSGNHYLYGSYFISYLVEQYGEKPLWELIERQGKSFFFPFIVNERFRAVYGESLSQLLDDFADYVAKKYPVRSRPQAQRVVRELGTNGRYARAADGTEAVVTEAMDDPPLLTVYDPQGGVRYRGRLVDVLPRRNLVTPDAMGISGLRFSRDASALYFVAVDQGTVFQETRLLRLDLASKRVQRLATNLGGLGGDISPDGKTYVFVLSTGHGHALASYEIETGRTRVLFPAPQGVFLSSPNFSPDGQTIVASAFDGASALYLFDGQTGRHVQTLSAPDRPVYDATFIDDDRLLFTGEYKKHFQIFVYQRSTGETARLTDAPYLAQFARASQGTVRFFNRVDSHYSLDEVALPAPGQFARARLDVRFLAQTSEANAPASEAVGAGEAPPVLELAPSESTNVPVAAQSATTGPAVEKGIVPPLPPVDLSLASGPTQPLPAPPSVSLLAPRDEPYSVFPRLLIPSIRAPQIGVGSVDGSVQSPSSLGLYLGGTDALGLHRWGMSAGLQPGSWLFSGSVGYLNSQMAPFLWMLSGSQIDYQESLQYKVDSDGDGKLDDRRTVKERKRQRDASLTMFAVLRTSWLGAALHVTDDYQPDTHTLPFKERTLGGGTLTLGHVAVESTPMSGPRRGYRLELSGTFYPEALGTLDTNITDVRGALNLYSPLPFSRRHTLELGLRGRAVMHSQWWHLLEVGGNPGGALFVRPASMPTTPYPGLPASRRFQEPLRGFETQQFLVDRIAIADLRYRYPIIFDTGTATSLWILPAFFLRELDIELFGSAATDDFTRLRQRGHLALGGSLAVRAVWLGPLVLRYQLSKRLTDDLGLQHLLTIGADLDL